MKCRGTRRKTARKRAKSHDFRHDATETRDQIGSFLGQKWANFCAHSFVRLIVDLRNPRVFDDSGFGSVTSACLRRCGNNWISEVRRPHRASGEKIPKHNRQPSWSVDYRIVRVSESAPCANLAACFLENPERAPEAACREMSLINRAFPIISWQKRLRAPNGGEALALFEMFTREAGSYPESWHDD